MDQQYERGELPIGLEVDGVVHRTFALRMCTLADLLKVEALGLAKKGQRHETAALIAEQLVALGTLPKEKINLALLSRLHTVDYLALVQADQRLEQRVSSFRGEQPGAGASTDGAGAGDSYRVE